MNNRIRYSLHSWWSAGIVICTLLVSQHALAEPVFRVGLNLWSQDLSGKVKYQGDTADTEKDFAIVDPEDSVKLYFETRDMFPFYPDFRFYYDSFRYVGQTSRIYNYGKQPFAEHAKVVIGSETFGFIAFYKRKLSEHLEGAAGLDIRNVSFDVTLTGFNASSKQDLEVTFSGTKELISFIPMLFAKLETHIPDTTLYTYAEGNFTRLENNMLTDFRVALGTGVFGGITMEAGYRKLIYVVRKTSKDINIDLDISGTFIELGYDF